MNVEGIDRLGSTVLSVGSSGPGTSTKCVDLLITAYEAIKSPRAVKFSAAQQCQLLKHPMLCKQITLVLLSVPDTCWGNVTGREIPTEDNHFRNKIQFHTIVKYFSDPVKRSGMIQPHIRKDKKVEIGELLLDTNCIPGLGDYWLSVLEIHQTKGCVRLPVALLPPFLRSLYGRILIWM